MSWDVALRLTDGSVVKVPEHREGGTVVLGTMVAGEIVPGGLEEAVMNVTYNYRAILNFCGVHPDDLHNKSGDETHMLLSNAHVRLMDVAQVSEHGWPGGCGDYWHACAGNVARACQVMALWAMQHPGAYWDIT